MRTKLLHEVQGLRTFVVVMAKDDEAMAELMDFAREHEVTRVGLTAVGAARDGLLGYSDPTEMVYQDVPRTGQAEVLSLVSDVAVQGTSPALHVHGVFGLRDGSTVGGRVQRLKVWPTLEIVVPDTPKHLAKRGRGDRIGVDRLGRALSRDPDGAAAAATRGRFRADQPVGPESTYRVRVLAGG